MIDDRLARFRSVAVDRESPSGIMCVRCGSTKVDQNSLHELHCYSCGQTVRWEGQKLTVLRRVTLTEQAIGDAENALRRDRLRKVRR